MPGNNKALGFATGGYNQLNHELITVFKISKPQLKSFEYFATDGRPGDWIMLYTPGKRTILVVKVA
jgi:hypothetical protein